MAPTRPVWSDAGDDEKAVARLLRDAAGHGTGFTPARRTGDPTVLHRAAILVARDALSERHGEADRILSQEVAALDDLVRAANLLMERLREWYALHAPEAVRAEGDPQKLAAAVAKHGERGAVMQALEMAKAPSIGTDLDSGDLAAVQSLAAGLEGLHGSWRIIESRITTAMDDVAPALAALLGPMVGARLIAAAGGLERLAVMPAGTAQTLGAETALFRHLREGAKPPKHGLLFQHPLLFQAPPWQRGAIARTMANLAVLAARADRYGDPAERVQRGTDLKEKLEAAVQDIRRRRPKAPPRPRSPGGKGGKGGKGRGPGGKPRGKPHGKPHGKPGGKPRGKPPGKASGRPGKHHKGGKPQPPPGRGGRP